MKRGVAGGIAVCLLLVAAWAIRIAAVTVYVNDVLPPLENPVLVEDGSILVPIEGFGLAVGIETAIESDRLVLRWSGGTRGLASDQYAAREGVPYATLEWMVGLVGGEVHRVGDTWYVETTVATLEEIEATGERVVLRFDGFVPITIVESDESPELRYTLHHCRSEVEPQLILLGEEGIESVRLPSGGRNSVDVRVDLQDGATVGTKTYESPGFYSLCLEATERPATETVIQVDEGFALHRLETVLSAETVRADWLYVEAWRDRYRLTPVFPESGFETAAPIEELAFASDAVAAINLGCSRTPIPVDLLIIDGTPYTVGGGTYEGLGLDLFGWWVFFSGDATVSVKHGGQRVPVDDVNRPLHYGEIVAYAPGYVGGIARGVLGSFTVVKVRSDRVVSVYEGPFVAADPTATLVVASGEAKARLSLVRLGDGLSLECGIGPGGTSFSHAFSAGPVLVDSGLPAAIPESLSPDSPHGWAVLATDWHGGLTLLSFVRERGNEADAFGDLIALLATMPVPIRDAIVLSRCGENALVVRDPSSIYRFGSGDPYALALCLVPLSP
jgi:hypothetical protein